MDSDETGALRRVIPVGQSLDIPSGGSLYVTVIEVWDKRIAVHSEEHLPAVPPDRPSLLCGMSDDVGSTYVYIGGGSSGSRSHRQSTHRFAGTVPAAASQLLLTGLRIEASRPILIDVGGPG